MGAYDVTGANDSRSRLAPSFGVSAGIVLDAGVARVALGGGGQMVRTGINGVDNTVMAGPAMARLDVGSGLRVAGAVAFGKGQRFRASPTGGNTEARDATSIGAFLGPALSTVLFPTDGTHSLVLDVAIGGAAIFLWGNPGLTNAQAWGGELRITLSLPLTLSDGIGIGAMIRNDAAGALTGLTRALPTAEESKAISAGVRDAQSQRIGAEIDSMQSHSASTSPGTPQYCPDGTTKPAEGGCTLMHRGVRAP